jgi:hypothetical protein
MNKDIYPFQNLEESKVYLFVSEGVCGKIAKGVLIRPIPEALSYGFTPAFNLGFGDIVATRDEWILDHAIRSGNGDMSKVIATVAQIGIDFLRKHPGSALSFKGYIDAKSAQQNSNPRNSLYQRGINSNWAELSAEFDFWGIKEGQVQAYAVGCWYDQILVKHR